MTYSVQKRYVTPGKCRRPPLPDWALATYSLLGHVASWAVDPIGYALSEGSKRGTGASPRATTCGWGPVGDHHPHSHRSLWAPTLTGSHTPGATPLRLRWPLECQGGARMCHHHQHRHHPGHQHSSLRHCHHPHPHPHQQVQRISSSAGTSCPRQACCLHPAGGARGPF